MIPKIIVADIFVAPMQTIGTLSRAVLGPNRIHVATSIQHEFVGSIFLLLSLKRTNNNLLQTTVASTSRISHSSSHRRSFLLESCSNSGELFLPAKRQYIKSIAEMFSCDDVFRQAGLMFFDSRCDLGSVDKMSFDKMSFVAEVC